LVVENKTGEVLAYASVDAEGRSQVDGVLSRRQAGSALKPFLYALAFEERLLTPASLLQDRPLDLPVSGGVFSPQNYDKTFRGLVSGRTALASSLNIPAVNTLSLVGTEAYLRILRLLGIQGLGESGDFYGPSLSLGTADVSLWELVAAFRTLSRGGIYGKLRLRKDEETAPAEMRVFSEEAAFLVSHILSDREARSGTFGLESPLSTRFWSAVKTGTSKDMRDNWCIGYTRDYTVGVWVGNFTGSPMWDVSGITGAAPVWVGVMNFLHGDRPSRPPDPPAGLVKAHVRFPAGVEPSREEWFVAGMEPEGDVPGSGRSGHGIQYPPSGTVIAHDPDIPPDRQIIVFECRPWGPGLCWVLNGTDLTVRSASVPWAPRPGRFTLAVRDRDGRILDSVWFEVRGRVKSPAD
jgi:penicillin-binding protein 1C